MKQSLVTKTVRVKRTHGLGNMLMLMPVLKKMSDNGVAIEVITKSEWADVFGVLFPFACFCSDKLDSGSVDSDLDVATYLLEPQKHRAEEFGDILGEQGPFSPLAIPIPNEWVRPFLKYKGYLLFAPEAAHVARRWPLKETQECIDHLEAKGHKVALIGETMDTLRCRTDLRGLLSLQEVLGLCAAARGVITMDSGALHLALLVDTPAIAIFSGIEPAFRIFSEQKVTVVQSALPCCPCNKKESCNGLYPCLAEITTQSIVEELDRIHLIKKFTVKKQR